jgi:chemotaxis protein CheC
MTQPLVAHAPSDRVADRARELTSIGAGHAAGALATLIGRACEMGLPLLGLIPTGEPTPLGSDLGTAPGAWSGTLFEVEGGFGGVLGVLLSPAGRRDVLASLLGERASAQPHAESAVREVGNILASHALSALGDTLGARVLPSPPTLAWQDAPAAFASAAAGRPRRGPLLRVEVAIRERGGALLALLVYVPDDPARFATTSGF